MIRKALAIVTAVLLASSAATVLSAQAPREGITVHGHWVLEVTNPDGTLAERREFENALTQYGPAVLAGILTKTRTVGQWGILLTNGSPNPCGNVSGYCFLGQPGHADMGVETFDTLTVSSGPAGETVVLIGSFTAVNDGVVRNVATQLTGCGPATTPADCHGASAAVADSFTSTHVKDKTGADSTLPLLKDQGFRVTVTISFTSPPGGH